MLPDERDGGGPERPATWEEGHVARNIRQRDIAIDGRSARQRCESAGRRATGVSDELRRLAESLKAVPLLDTRAADAILDYDEHGLPR